ncbi:MAG: TonB-dependent receptor [Dysgonamonadaceae bacterium]|jgi:outer membrane receptor protein involved in Fe transport|nr:TonB-dependent receptor [Dysgonamonadaceae bacterium]
MKSVKQAFVSLFFCFFPFILPAQTKSSPEVTVKGEVRDSLFSRLDTLQEVVVTAYRPLVQVDLDKVTYSVKDDPDSKTENVLEMLKKVPMITVDGEDKVELKGSGNFKIYLDGKPSNLISNNPSQVLRSMPANTVKSIEVITDPGAKYDAEGVSGIINIITNKQPLGGYTVSLNAGADHWGGHYGGGYFTLKYDKIGFTGNFNYYRFVSPDGSMSSYRESYPPSETFLFSDGKQNYKGLGQYGYGEWSYEIDTLNLLSFSYNRNQGDAKGNGRIVTLMEDGSHQPVYEYNQQGNMMQTWGSTELNLNYQRSFKKKDELLTASYQYSFSPNDSETDAKIEYVQGTFPDSWRRQNTDAGMKEHTFQLDYTVPLAEIHTLEGGAKYILRLNESHSGHYDYIGEAWVPIAEYAVLDEFSHRQNILSAYGSYNLRYKKTGFKTGLRLEQTSLNVRYPVDEMQNFGASFFNLVPSATFSYRLNDMQTLRLGYNLRIRRPGISELNPYVNTTFPEFVSSGNPNLETVKSHNFNLNYNYSHRKFNLNSTLSYNFTGNSIQNYKTLDHPDYPNISYSTYGNIGKTKDTRLDAYLNWNPVKLLRIYSNMSVSYRDIHSNNNEMNFSNSGFMENIHGGIQFNLPKDFSLSFNGGWSSPRIGIQGNSTGWHYTNVSLNKSFLKKKLTFSIRGHNLTETYFDYASEILTDKFYERSSNSQQARRFSISVSYRFGEMKQQIKKVQRGIENDDVEKSSGSGAVGTGE